MLGNRYGPRTVVLVVGMIRGVGAALAAAVVALSGCASTNEEQAPTAQAPDAPVNPWDLPLVERPDLFDPCAEIPIEAIEEGVGSPVEPVEQYSNNRPGDLVSCGWKNKEVHVSVLSTWKSHQQYLADSTLRILESDSAATGRSSLRMRERADSTGNSCFHIFFTSSGTVLIKLDMTTGLNEFLGDNFVEPCDALDKMIIPTVAHIPPGNF